MLTAHQKARAVVPVEFVGPCHRTAPQQRSSKRKYPNTANESTRITANAELAKLPAINPIHPPQAAISARTLQSFFSSSIARKLGCRHRAVKSLAIQRRVKTHGPAIRRAATRSGAGVRCVASCSRSPGRSQASADSADASRDDAAASRSVDRYRMQSIPVVTWLVTCPRTGTRKICGAMGIRTPDLLHAISGHPVHGSPSPQVRVLRCPLPCQVIRPGCGTFPLCATNGSGNAEAFGGLAPLSQAREGTPTTVALRSSPPRTASMTTSLNGPFRRRSAEPGARTDNLGADINTASCFRGMHTRRSGASCMWPCA